MIHPYGIFSAAESYGKSDATLEIVIMLLVAFILGYLLRYFLAKTSSDNDTWKIKYEEIKHEHELLQKKFDMFDAENRRLSKELDACLKKSKQPQNFAALSAKSKPVRKDDLKKVEGIGPKIEKMLQAEGIYTWQDLAETSVEHLKQILDKGGPAYKVHNPESWPFQADLAAKGKWDELKKWQAEHKHGRF
jgi:predicted flap endonuclease-1-like 5' DNA nuclease